MPSRQAQYQPLAANEEEAEEGDVSQPNDSRRGRSRRTRRLSRGAIDLRKVDAAFKRWTDNIAQKVKLAGRKAKKQENVRREITHSVFGQQVPAHEDRASTSARTLDHKATMTHAGFAVETDAIRSAIAEGVHPKMISKGSSGSYFARARVDGRIQTVAVFKPKDEEPYGKLNPKTTKWIHRKMSWLIPFGRACLIPNLSYVSEAAASLLDTRLELNIVPRTELVSFSSPAFFYDWIDRNAAKKGKPLPGKIGSLQHFLHGFTDASEFLRQHPIPGRLVSDTYDDSNHRTGTATRRFLSAMNVICGKTGDETLYDNDNEDENDMMNRASHDDQLVGSSFYWSQAMQDSFREELEKLIILDYIMRNTDRGADNYMLKYCEGDHSRPVVSTAPSRSTTLQMPEMGELRSSVTSMGVSTSPGVTFSLGTKPGVSREEDNTRHPHLHVAAIDNSLSFPHEHPKGWRRYTYGWLYLPVTVIGRPFSQATRQHFLPLLTSTSWWTETTFQLREIFRADPDFNEKMFRRQLAVLKGQAWNVVQCLKHSDEGPLELTRRVKVLVWDDEVEPDDDEEEHDSAHPTSPASPQPSIRTLPARPHRSRSQSLGRSGDFPPRMRRSSTDMAGVLRPVSFSTKFQKAHPGTTGVRVLEHLERLDAVEHKLARLGVEEDQEIIPEEDEERDLADAGPKPRPLDAVNEEEDESDRPLSPRRSMTDSQQLVGSDVGDSGDMSASLAWSIRTDVPTSSSQHLRWSSDQQRPSPIHESGDVAGGKRTVIVERLEVVKDDGFSCW